MEEELAGLDAELTALQSGQDELFEEQLREKKAVYDQKAAIFEQKKEQYAQLQSAFMPPEEVDELVKEKELALKTLLLEKKEDELDFSYAQSQVEKQKEKVALLKQNENENEILSPVSGIVSEIRIAAGDTLAENETAVRINVMEDGYTVSIFVSDEQSKYVKVGDPATVLNLWDEAASAELIKIRADPENPDKGRILTFRVSGDALAAGQTLAISVGEMQSTYDYLVPLGAVHEDNGGKFIYLLKAKATPVKNRYNAVRKAVTVLASDDRNAAISGDFGSDDYIITDSVKPIADGVQVRPADEG